MCKLFKKPSIIIFFTILLLIPSYSFAQIRFAERKSTGDTVTRAIATIRNIQNVLHVNFKIITWKRGPGGYGQGFATLVIYDKKFKAIDRIRLREGVSGPSFDRSERRESNSRNLVIRDRNIINNIGGYLILLDAVDKNLLDILIEDIWIKQDIIISALINYFIPGSLQTAANLGQLILNTDGATKGRFLKIQ